MTRVIVLGASGMLGGAVAAVLAADPELAVTAAVRRNGAPASVAVGSVRRFDAASDDAGALLDEGFDCVVNAIGVTKPHIHERDPASLRRALELNALFPYELAARASERGQRVVQIATDGVFSGREGTYLEEAPHDALDAYGRTKSLGEVPSGSVLHLRCSVVGPEPRRSDSLLSWVLGHPPGARLDGFVNHRWNGVTTYQFARLCGAIAKADLELPSPLHVVPADVVTKAELLEAIRTGFGRDDLEVTRATAPTAADRSLGTSHLEANERLWAAGGYAAPPTVAAMVHELAERMPDWPGP